MYNTCIATGITTVSITAFKISNIDQIITQIFVSINIQSMFKSQNYHLSKNIWMPHFIKSFSYTYQVSHVLIHLSKRKNLKFRMFHWIHILKNVSHRSSHTSLEPNTFLLFLLIESCESHLECKSTGKEEMEIFRLVEKFWMSS